MMPGSTSRPPIEFPSTWLGLWKDLRGHVIYFERTGPRQLMVTFGQGLHLPLFPLPDGGQAYRLPGLYLEEPGIGPLVEVSLGSPVAGKRILLKFTCPSGDRLRFAEPWDLVSLISIHAEVIGLEETFYWMDHNDPFRKDSEAEKVFKREFPDLG